MSIHHSARGVNFCLVRAGSVLLQQRDENCPYGEANKWCFPGGASEPEDQSLQETAVREIAEEYQVYVPLAQCQYLTNRPAENPGEVYVCLVPDEQEPVLREGKAMAWVPITDLRDIELGFRHGDFIVPALMDWHIAKEQNQEIRPFRIR